MDPLNLKAALRKRDKIVDDAADGKGPDAPADKPADNAAFFKKAAADAPDVKAKKASRLAELIKARDEKVDEYKKAWSEDK